MRSDPPADPRLDGAGSDLLIGLRDADLTETERAARDALRARSSEAAAAHQQALGWTDALAQLPTPARPKRRAAHPRVAVWSAGLLAAALALLAIGAPRLLSSTNTTRDRAVMGTQATAVVQLAAAAEGPTGLRPLQDGARVGPDEWVVFRTNTDTTGTLTLTERTPAGTQRIYPTAGHAWTVEAGAHLPGGDAPISWRPDQGGGARTYTVELCPARGDCVQDQLTLHWTSSR